ncbi:ThuA domain-containing protein [Streptomyces radicis]|uniref:ThuA domain-containing protein n=1 Tax=Streptomyces radicis TaxID=1750517 RepID=A0A3A9VZ36_9ACTN|nr:ThuA domain-containing protein [Streptomyces radicis]RKN05999.1 ThuA domain-containing protein [Streptomyces radicis]RKN17693.1 ThuA domain-containing protein [Streptomyces radicis]
MTATRRADPAPPATRQALVVRGGWDGHSPVALTNLFVPFLARRGFRVLVEESLEVYEDEKLLAETDLIVQSWSMGDITPAETAGLSAAVRAGTGLAGWHGGIVDAFRGDHDYQLLTGGQFLGHPPGFARHRVSLEPAYADHPVLAGLGDFEVHTEKYWVATDPLNDVLATVTFEADETRPRAVAMPAVWTRTWGRGRVFVSTIGHKPDDFDVPEVRALTERGLLWASR